MINAMRAYLRTEGSVDYRQCKIAYYTYSMFETPNKFKVNVNVHIHSPKKELKKTLNLDNSFDNETEAINYGIDEGKRYIDSSYESGSISFLKAEEPPRRYYMQVKKPSYAPPNNKPQTQHKDQK